MNAQVQLHGSGVGQPDRATHLRFDPAVIHPNRTLSELIELNRYFLLLLASEPPGTPLAPHAYSLPDTVARSLSLLSKEGISTAAQCPFSLFELPQIDTDWFERSDFTPEPNRFHDHRWSYFVQAVLFFAWHLVREARLKDSIYARLLLGLDSRMIATLRATPLAALSAVAIRFCGRLEPRWPRHARFWPDLIRCSGDQNGKGLCAVRLLGRQLLAAGNLSPVTVKSRRA